MPDIQLVITMNEQGQIGVSGPIDNQVLSYGLLEIAKITIANRAREAGERLVQPAAPGTIIPRG